MPPTELPVDNYQGEESDLVIGSFVRSNDDGQMGFVGDANRLNVAISRARCVVGPLSGFSLVDQSFGRGRAGR